MRLIKSVCLVLGLLILSGCEPEPEPGMITLFRAARKLADEIAAHPRETRADLVYDLRSQIIQNKHLLQFHNVRRQGSDRPDLYEPMWRAEIREALTPTQQETLARAYPKLMHAWIEDEPLLITGLNLVREDEGGRSFGQSMLGIAQGFAMRSTNRTLIAAVDIAGWPLNKRRLVKAENRISRDRERREHCALALASFGHMLRQDCAREP